jgi:sugar lactone lactonase YvrE
LLIVDQPFFDITVTDPDIEKDLEKISKADFIAFDERFFDVIGSEPTWESLYDLPDGLREAPVYIPQQNTLYFSDQAAGKLIALNLTEEPPTYNTVPISPPLEGINGMMYSTHDGLIYATVNKCPSAEAGIYSIDPVTLKTKSVVNNFIGHPFNSPNDLAVSPGGIWFTDPPYAALLGNASAAELRAVVYYYNISTSILRPVEEDIQLPNGIATSVDGKTLYIADSGALCQPIGQPTIPTRHHTVYAYDIVAPGHIRNKRLYYIADLWVPDGLKVSRNGYLYSAAGRFVDVIDTEGVLLGKITFPGIVANVEFAGENYDDLWIVGFGGIFRAKIKDQGVDQGRKHSQYAFNFQGSQ